MNKRNIKKLFLVIISILIILATIFIIIQKNKEQIELTQLSSQINDRMMGYIIKTKNGKIIVIDGGMDEDAENLKKYIEQNGNKVDYWLITHPHKDHVGAFINLIENSNIEIGKIYYSINNLEWYKTYATDRFDEVERFFNAVNNDKIKDKKIQPNIGDIIDIDNNIKIEILGINNPEITANAINNSSMVFKIYINDKSILFLGDTGKESSQKLIENKNINLKSDIVQLAHHGQNGATEELYKLVQPNICLWPTPEWLWNNDSGQGYDTGPWTTLETRNWIEELGVKTNYIAKDGDVTIIIK